MELQGYLGNLHKNNIKKFPYNVCLRFMNSKRGNKDGIIKFAQRENITTIS